MPLAALPSRLRSGVWKQLFRHLQLQIQLRILTGFLIKFDQRTPKNAAKIAIKPGQILPVSKRVYIFAAVLTKVVSLHNNHLHKY
jgi:hypothetical protein